MKAIKRNFENLQKVCNSIVRVDYSNGKFDVDFVSEENNFIRLRSFGRDGVGSSILGLIPSNYFYRVSFIDGCLYLTIWFD